LKNDIGIRVENSFLIWEELGDVTPHVSTQRKFELIALKVAPKAVSKRDFMLDRLNAFVMHPCEHFRTHSGVVEHDRAQARSGHARIDRHPQHRMIVVLLNRVTRKVKTEDI